MTSSQQSQANPVLPEAQIEAMALAALNENDPFTMYEYLKLALAQGQSAMSMYSRLTSGAWAMPRHYEDFMDQMADGLGDTSRPWNDRVPRS